MKKEIYAKMTKAAVLSVFAAAMIAAPAFAADGDLWNGTQNIGSVSHVKKSMPSTFLDIVNHPEKYSYEVNGKGYSILAANGIFETNPNASLSDIQVKMQSDLTGTPLNQVFTVSSVSANSLKVVFTQAPADTSKVVITVTRSNTPVVVTTTWNSANTEATVSSTSNLPEGSYTIAVQNDTTALGSSTIALSRQKIAKINILSSKLSITGENIGLAAYNVLDQYGNDITKSSLANNITFQSSDGTVTADNGLLKVTLKANIQVPTILITGIDSTSGIFASATLTITTDSGTLSTMTLNTLTNADNKVLTDGDTSSTWYIDYTATDISGKPTKDYNLVKNGLNLDTINGNPNCLTTSSSFVQAQLVKDPSDSNKAAIAVTVIGNKNIFKDMPVAITAITYSGTTSTLNVTLTTSTDPGTLSTMTLNTLTNVDNKVLTDGDTSSTWYINYTATDISGKPTKDYNLVKNGLILTTINGNQNCLTTSSSYIQAQLVKDPGDSNKAAIAVTVIGDKNISIDMPITITAMIYSGTTSTLNTTLKKASTVDTFTLIAPSYDIASGESKEIPFVAYDQYGTKLTKYDDINGAVILTGGATLTKNVDGTASVFVQAITNTGSQCLSQTFTAVTTTGNVSIITLNIQPVVSVALR